MIRAFMPEDMDTLKRLQCGFDWKLGKDFLGAEVAEEDGHTIAIAGFWGRAEAHMVIDHDWATPERRLAVLEELHGNISPRLHEKRIGEVWTFLDDMPGFQRRLQVLDWHPITKQAWGRRTNG